MYCKRAVQHVYLTDKKWKITELLCEFKNSFKLLALNTEEFASLLHKLYYHFQPKT